MADGWQELLKSIKEDVLKNRAEIKSAIEASEARVLLKIEDLQRRINTLEKENLTLTKKIEHIERSTKKNNILVFGLKEDIQNSAVNICNTLTKLLEVEVSVNDLNNVYSIKSLRNTVKVEFISNLKKTEILRNARKLKDSGISIAQDLTFMQREENKLLRKYLKKARENPVNTSYIKGNKLYVNNKCYTVDELEELDSDLEDERKINSAPPTPTSKKYPEEEQEVFEDKTREEQKEAGSGTTTLVQVKAAGTNITPKTLVNKQKQPNQKSLSQVLNRQLRSGSQSSQK